MAAAALGIFAVAFAQVAHSEQGSGSVDYTVRPGDSVWSIAAERYPSADTRAKVGEILAANGMASPVLASGEHLKLPQS